MHYAWRIVPDRDVLPVTAWLLEHAALARFAVVAGVFLIMLLLQMWIPRRGEISPRGRYLRNLSLPLISAVIVYLLLPLTLVSFAALIADKHLGLFNFLEWPAAIEFAITLIALDLAIYWQHRAMHELPWLWRLHRLHHTDLNFDLTLGLRFHPFEILFSLVYKGLVVVALGASPLAVLCYEILLAVFALFSHADIRIGGQWDQRLRKFVITPDWHRVHHSIHRNETDSNYGNFLSAWDRLFGSTSEQPRDGHLLMKIGLGEFRDEASQHLPGMLMQPFFGDKSSTGRNNIPHA